jgi:uncharacterized Tic20 family protein
LCGGEIAYGAVPREGAFKMTINPDVVPPPVATSDKALMILCHVSALIGVGFVLPFVVWLVKKNDPDAVADHAKETLNFHLSWLLYALLCVPLMFIVVGVPLAIILGVAALVLAIVGAVKASDGVLYRYPLTIRFIG